MTEKILTEIDVSCIIPSPYQHRRVFDESALRELARSIERDGLIQPITVRKKDSGYELIAGERRWRACCLAGIPTIAARILEVNDLQARRLCATENLQRVDLSCMEEIQALAELVDASLLLDCGDEYTAIGNVQEPKWRVKTLLMKLDSDIKHGTDYFGNNFIPKVCEIFSGLPKSKDWQSFQKNDLPLIFTSEELQAFAIDNRLNKSQTKAFKKMEETAPSLFREIRKAAPEQAAQKIASLADPFAFHDEIKEVESFADLSAETIKKAASYATKQPELIHNHRAQGTGENEWYTPMGL